MSRSYKKAIFKSNGGTKKMKRLAAKAARNCDDLDNGSAYKKAFSSYEICDYIEDCRFDPLEKQYYSKYTGLYYEETYLGRRPDKKKRENGWHISK